MFNFEGFFFEFLILIFLYIKVNNSYCMCKRLRVRQYWKVICLHDLLQYINDSGRLLAQ